MKKTYVIDTNILLTDPRSLFAFADNDIVLPFTAIEELDKIKGRQNEVGANAREVARILSEMISKNEVGSLKKGIELENGGNLRIAAVSDFSLEEKLSKDWDPLNKDNHILDVCRGLAEQNEKEGKSPPVLVTKDIILRVKSDFIGIACEDFKASAVVDRFDHIFSGLKILDVPEDIIQSFWELSENETHFDLDPAEFSDRMFSPNEFIQLRAEGTDSSEGPLLRYLSPDEPCLIVRDHKAPVYNILPRNQEQTLSMNLLLDPKVKLVTTIGKAGGGKTLLALAAGLNQVIEKKRYKSLLVCRPVVPVGNDIGFLPGDKNEKLEPWIAPIKDNLRYLLFSGKKTRGAESTLQAFFDDGIIEVEAITYLRGRSIANAYIIIDEAQNLTQHELKTIITRVGENTKIVLTGDVEQIDTIYLDSVSNGLTIAVEKFRPYEISGHITLVKGERSELATLASEVL
jgi:PhoH-like ATPase